MTKKHSKTYYIFELLLTTIVLILTIVFNDFLVNIYGYQTKLRIFTLCAVPLLRILFPIVACWLTHTKKEELGYRHVKIREFALTSIFLFMIMILANIVFPIIVLHNSLANIAGLPYYESRILVFRLFYYFFIIGFSEEFLFRGYYYQRIQYLFHNDIISIVIVSILFGGMHFIGNSSLYSGIFTTISSLFYCYFARIYKHGSTLVASLVHGAYDTSLVLIATFL